MLAHLNKEPGWHAAARLLSQSRAAERPLLMCAVNVAEVRYRMWRKGGLPAAVAACDSIKSIGIALVPVDEDLAFAAADLKADTPVAFADCFAAALARLNDAEVATGDPEFRKFGDRVKVLWLGDPDGAGDS